MSHYPPPPGMDGQRQATSRYNGLPPPPPPPPGSNSYRPPPPPMSSLPPRPPSNNYDSYQGDRYGDRDRDRDRDRDHRYSRRDRDDRYQPPRDDYRSLPPRPQDSYRDSRANGRDSFRPPQSDFTFRSDKPSSVGDSYRPSEPDHPRGAPRGPARSSYQDRRSGPRGYRGRGGGHHEPRRAWKPFRPAERAILQGSGNALPAEDFADTENGVTYRAVDQLSDSDEAAMDTSDSDNESGEPRAKRARTVAQTKTEDNTPKWSNPDPYDALPPIEESERKRKDMVQLIRKARVEPSENARAALPAPTEDEDFIRCDSDSDDGAKKDKDDEEVFIDPLTYNRGGASTQAAVTAPTTDNKAPSLPNFPAAVAPSLPGPVPPPPNPPVGNGTQRAPNGLAPSNSSGLASRKRTHDDVLKLPDHARLKPVQRQPVGGAMVQEWRSKSGETTCPWIKTPITKVSVNVR